MATIGVGKKSEQKFTFYNTKKVKPSLDKLSIKQITIAVPPHYTNYVYSGERRIKFVMRVHQNQTNIFITKNINYLWPQKCR